MSCQCVRVGVPLPHNAWNSLGRQLRAGWTARLSIRTKNAASAWEGGMPFNETPDDGECKRMSRMTGEHPQLFECKSQPNRDK